MKPFYESAGTTLYLGDCVEVMRELPECSIDAVVTDPPYGLHFMGKSWDQFGGPLGTDHKNGRERSGSMHAGEVIFSRNHEFQRHMTVWAREAFRVLKPGGHLLAFGGTRTYHRLACAIEDAGFEIKDSIHWFYGSGFPKSLNVGKSMYSLYSQKRRAHGLIPLAGTETMQRFTGSGTALKPAHEPVVMARKPLSASSVARNVLEHRTGAINVDECRVSLNGQNKTSGGCKVTPSDVYRHGLSSPVPQDNSRGRWPANLLLSHAEDCERVGIKRVRGIRGGNSTNVGNAVYGKYEAGLDNKEAGFVDPDGTEEVEAWECAPGCPILELDRQSGNRKSGAWNGNRNTSKTDAIYGSFESRAETPRESSEGGASRFFSNFSPDVGPGFLYQAKASRSERNRGLEGMPEERAGVGCSRPSGDFNERLHGKDKRSLVVNQNNHPTVKPLALMRWLVRLVTPPGGLVLDPFAGSGTTGLAAIAESLGVILIEREEEYANICRARLEHGVEEAAPIRRVAKPSGATSVGVEQLELDWGA